VIAKSAASARVERFGISYPPSAWKADCGYGSGDGWRCAVGTGGTMLERRHGDWDEHPAPCAEGRRVVLALMAE
jgi:hypothetical protein